jgi:hypothetical protein
MPAATAFVDLVQRITNEATADHGHEESHPTDQNHGIDRLEERLNTKALGQERFSRIAL